MAYFFITDDNKIYAGGGNYYGETGTNTSGGSSSYAYSLYPPREIVYETIDGTILDGSMVKSIVSGKYSGGSKYSGTLLLTNSGEVFVCGVAEICGDKTQSKVFKKLETDKNGNKLPKIEKVFTSNKTAFLLTKEGIVYSCGNYQGRSSASDPYYDIVSVDEEGNPLPPIADILTYNEYTAFLTKDGEVYTFGYSNTSGIYDDENFESHHVYYPRKARIKNVVKVVATNLGFFCLDKFGQLWKNGNLSHMGYVPYSGKYYDGNTYAPYINLNKLSVNEMYIQHYNDTKKYPFPKKVIDIMPFTNYPIIKYLDEDGNVNVLTHYNTHKYFGAGTSPSNNKYLYNHKGANGIWDFENTYEGIYNFDNNGIGTLTKEGKLYVAGGKGTTGSTSDRFTSAVIMPGTENLTITKVFGSISSEALVLKDELYPMPDVSKPKIKIQSMI